MKKLDQGRLCGVYLSLMSSVFLLGFSPAGYLNIAETKFAVFCFLSGCFILLYLILSLKGIGCVRRQWNAVHALLLAYWGWSMLSTACSPWLSTALLGGGRFDGMLSITLYLAVLVLLSRCGDCSRFPLWLPAAALSILCIVAILQFFDLNPLWLYPGGLRWSGRESEYNGAFLSLTGNADLTASVLCCGFGFLWPLGLGKGKRLLLLPAGACLAVLAASEVRGGLAGAVLGLLICLPSLLPIGKKAKKRTYIGLLLLGCLALILVYCIPMAGTAGELHAILHGRADDAFGSGRVYIWRSVWRLVKERPLLGGGPDTLGERGLAFVKAVPGGAAISRVIDCAHSEPLNVLVNQGLPALLFLTAAFILTLVRAFRCPGTAAAALRSALVSYVLASLFGIAMPANAAFFWILWGMLLEEIGKSRSNQRFNAV